MQKFFKGCFLFMLGGELYYLIEVLWRGYSHPAMLIVGGLCFLLIGRINESVLTWDMPLLKQMSIAAVMITVLELAAGLILNVWLGLGIWNYSNLPGNLWGQICLPFMAVWWLLSAVAILLDDYIRHWFFKEEKPRYKLI